MSPAACAFSRDVVTGARADGPTDVCAFSRDEPADAQVCVDNGIPVDDESSEWAFGEFPKIDTAITNTVKARMNDIKLSTLRYIDVDVGGQQCTGLVDSGAEICLISQELAKKIHADECGHIGMRGIFSDPIRLPLINVNIKRGGGSKYDNVADGIQVVCATAPLKETSHSVVLSADVVADLECMLALNVMCVKVQSCNNNVEHQSCNSCVNDCMAAEVDVNDDDDKSTVSVVDNADQLLVNDVADGNVQLIKAPHNDPTLASCWDMAKVNKGNYVVDHGILFHYDQVEGQKVCQLCVPECKRDAVLKLAHDSVFGGHLAERKTRERIRLSFHWPKLRQSVKQYVTTCHDCQLRSRPKMLDRVPIAAITRVDVPFQVLNTDCIGPTEPPSAQGHRYCLCIVDNCT